MNKEVEANETLAVIHSDVKKIVKHLRLDRRKSNDDGTDAESAPDPDNAMLESIHKAIADIAEQKSFTEEQLSKIIAGSGEYLYEKQDEHNTALKTVLKAICMKLDEQPTEPQKSTIRREHHFSVDFKNSKAALTMITMGFVILISLALNVYQADRNNVLRDNDIKYRYIKMQGKASPEDLFRLESIFTFDRNKDSVRMVRRQVERYEQLLKEYNEMQLQNRLNDARAKEIEQEAATVKNR